MGATRGGAILSLMAQTFSDVSPGPRRPATLADWEAVPPPYTAHLLAGKLHVLPRPRPAHARALTGLLDTLFGPFDRKRGGPGGWVILPEVDVRLGRDVVVPDLAGWRRERLPEVPAETPISLAPDWVSEILSPSTEAFDRGPKAEWYAAAGVGWLWFVDPEARLLEVYGNTSGAFRQIGRWQGAETMTAEPFDAISWPLAALWG